MIDWNIDAQKTFLSCIIQDNVLIDLTTVRPEFLVAEYKAIMEHMVKLRKEKMIISWVSLDWNYWVVDIWDIASFCFTTKEFETCQEIIIEQRNRYKIFLICDKVSFLAKDSNKTASELATIISDGLILESKEESDNLFPQLIDTFDNIFTKSESVYIVNTTWYTGLDSFLWGWRAGSLYIVAARPWIWKSTLMLNMMLKIIKMNVGCCILSTEMPTKEIHIRALSNISWVESRKIENWIQSVQDLIAEETVKFMTDQMGHCAIYDKFYFEDIERIISKEALSGRKIIFIDYLQQIPTLKTYMNKNSYIESITNKLKNLSIKYWISIVCLSQLKRTNSEPELTDLRDSWAIEQDADVVMFLHNDDEYTGDIDILVKKNRHRDKWWVKIKFNKKCFKMF